MNRPYLDMIKSHWAKEKQQLFFILTEEDNSFIIKNPLDFKDI